MAAPAAAAPASAAPASTPITAITTWFDLGEEKRCRLIINSKKETQLIFKRIDVDGKPVRLFVKEVEQLREMIPEMVEAFESALDGDSVEYR